MVTAWYSILVLMLGLFVVLDGYDIGAGTLHRVVGKTDADRRTVISAIGPFWLWHEVWLVGAGGVLVLAFPAVMATAFSGFYLALSFSLWALIGRGVAIELAGHVRDRLWRSFWDTAFAASSALLAVLLGVALGNVLRGVPLSPEGRFSLPLFTHFGVRGRVGLLDWYTISVAAFTFVCLAAHGASYLALRTEGRVNAAAHRQAARGWRGVALLLPVVTVMTWRVRPELFAGVAARPIGWLCVAVAALGLWLTVRRGAERAEGLRFLGGSAVIAGLLGGAAVGVFPVMLWSTLDAGDSITAFAGGAAPHGLRLGLVWWPFSCAMAVGYIAFVARRFGGKVGPPELDYGVVSGALADESESA
jgi:cytochrome d ubiquinol oxidase subunit II